MIPTSATVHTAVVAGATGTVGAALSTALSAKGYHLLLLGTDEHALIDVIGRTSAPSWHALWDCADLHAAATELDRTIQQFTDRFGFLSAVVNCTGIGGWWPIEEMSLDEWQAVLDVNVTGAFLLTRAAAQHMLKQGSGTVIHVSSAAASRFHPFSAAYSASKAALEAMACCADMELRNHGVRVWALAPTQPLRGSFLRSAVCRSAPSLQGDLSKRYPARDPCDADAVAGFVQSLVDRIATQ